MSFVKLTCALNYFTYLFASDCACVSSTYCIFTSFWFTCDEWRCL